MDTREPVQFKYDGKNVVVTPVMAAYAAAEVAERTKVLSSILRRVLLIGGGDFADTPMGCYCGAVMDENGELDEDVTCLVCKGWSALDNVKEKP